MAELCQGAQPTPTVNPPPHPGRRRSSPRTRPSRTVGGERITLPGGPMPSAPAEAEPRPTRAGHTPPAPAQGPLRRCPTDQSPEAPTAAVGGGAGPHPDRRSPHRGAAAPGRMLTSHRPGTLGTRRPGAPMPGAGRAPPPPRAPSLFWLCGIQRAQPRVPGGPHPRAPRATWLPPAVGEGRRGRRGWGRPHLRHGRVTVAGGSRVPAGADRGRPREREPLGLARGRLIRHPRPGDQNGAMSSPAGQKQAAGGRQWAPTRAPRSRAAARVLPRTPLIGPQRGGGL